MAGRIQTPACDRCTQGVMDATNDHYLGVCQCECHHADDIILDRLRMFNEPPDTEAEPRPGRRYVSAE